MFSGAWWGLRLWSSVGNEETKEKIAEDEEDNENEEEEEEQEQEREYIGEWKGERKNISFSSSRTSLSSECSSPGDVPYTSCSPSVQAATSEDERTTRCRQLFFDRVCNRRNAYSLPLTTSSSAYLGHSTRFSVTSATRMLGGHNAIGEYMTTAEAEGFNSYTTTSPTTPDAMAATFPSTENTDPKAYTMKSGNIHVAVRVRPHKGPTCSTPCCRALGQYNAIEFISPPREMPSIARSRSSGTGSACGRRTTDSHCAEYQLRQDDERSVNFTFDTVIGETATQEEIMARIGRPILRHVLDGYNGTVLCYGQSGSGKTHTMLWPAGAVPESLQNYEEIGLIPRMLESLFKHLGCKSDLSKEIGWTGVEAKGRSIASPQEMSGQRWSVKVSALELYKEELRDLLSTWEARHPPRSCTQYCNSTRERGFHVEGDSAEFSARLFSQMRAAGSGCMRFQGSDNGCQGTLQPSWYQTNSGVGSSSGLRVRQTAGLGVVVEGLKWHTVNQPEEAFRALKWAVQQRHIGSTALNKRSGRSHFFFYVTVQLWTAMEANSQGACSSLSTQRTSFSISRDGGRQSLMTLVDLAGSERVSDTQAAGKRLEEAQHINLSLTLLGNVIRKLTSSSKGKGAHIPYRDSKLTRLLQESIGGNAVTTLLCTISPNPSDAAESLSTLKFAKNAKLVQNQPVMGFVETKSNLLLRLKVLEEHNMRLQKELALFKRTNTAPCESVGNSTVSREYSNNLERLPAPSDRSADHRCEGRRSVTDGIAPACELLNTLSPPVPPLPLYKVMNKTAGTIGSQTRHTSCCSYFCSPRHRQVAVEPPSYGFMLGSILVHLLRWVMPGTAEQPRTPKETLLPVAGCPSCAVARYSERESQCL
ncbi:Microtubule binding Kinesin motor domain [Trypanosoma vivax]|uniref:Putative kinesin n=1 Tax=Trypanosoma vivax (strain Y486) TaxID=1055687 RepID=G0TZG2_TRYVY|nr:Microtubule binding Kinesin motor domain [Trypanosoma vivax]CCC49365.1 putative kinesin [Trypanosoma vivax Y486]